MQQKCEEPDPLFYHLPLSRVLNWNRWWHLIAKTVQLVLRKKTWAAIGFHSRARRETSQQVLSDKALAPREFGAEAHQAPL